MANTPQFTMRLDPVLREKLEAIAKVERRSLGNLVEVACLHYIEIVHGNRLGGKTEGRRKPRE